MNIFNNYDLLYSYHGTNPDNVGNILKYGLKKPGEIAGNK